MTAAALLALRGCSRAPLPVIQRIAILPFENLTGDAAFDWIRSAGPVILSEEVSGAAHLFPLRAPTVSEAALAGATRLLHIGYSKPAYSKRAVPPAGGPKDSAALHFEFAIDNPCRHTFVRPGALDVLVLFALTTLARHL